MSVELIPVHAVRPAALHIASIIAHVQPAALQRIRQWLETQPGVEIHAASDQGKLVVVIEAAQEQAILDLIDSITAQPGALNAALVYHEILQEEASPL